MSFTAFIRRLLPVAILALLVFAPMAAAQNFQNQATNPAPQQEDFDPPGTLWDNDVNNGTTSLASQNDDAGANLARTADDFFLDPGPCGTYQIDRIRIQIVQNDASAQPFGVELYDDDGTGASPAPVDAISPIAAFSETSQMNLGPFGAGTSMFEASFDDLDELIDAGDYWISGFGADGAQNAGGFFNFFAASNGAMGTTPNGVIIAPGAGVPVWTPVDVVIGPPMLAFSFAIDGACAGPQTTILDVPTMNSWGLVLLALLLAGASLFFVARRRA